MRDKHYKNRTIRLSDDVWRRFKIRRRLSEKSWNIFIRNLIKKPSGKQRDNLGDTESGISVDSRCTKLEDSKKELISTDKPT